MAKKPAVRNGQETRVKGRFKKGVSGNPGGRRSPAKKAIEKLLQDALVAHGDPNGKTGNFAFDEVWKILEEAEEIPHKLSALKLLIEYAYGKPAQRLKLSNDEDAQGQVLPLKLSA